MRLARVEKNRVTWCFDPIEYWGRNEIPTFNDESVVIDISNENEVQEGWYFVNGSFYASIDEIPEDEIELDVKTYKLFKHFLKHEEDCRNVVYDFDIEELVGKIDMLNKKIDFLANYMLSK